MHRKTSAVSKQPNSQGFAIFHAAPIAAPDAMKTEKRLTAIADMCAKRDVLIAESQRTHDAIVLQPLAFVRVGQPIRTEAPDANALLVGSINPARYSQDAC